MQSSITCLHILVHWKTFSRKTWAWVIWYFNNRRSVGHRNVWKQQRYIPGLNKQNQVLKNQTPAEFKLIIIANNSHVHPLPLMYEPSDRPPMFKSRLMLVNERIMWEAMISQHGYMWTFHAQMLWSSLQFANE